MPKWKAIVFDLDDTLYPEQQYVLSGFRAIAGYVSDRWNLTEASTLGALKAYFDAGVRGDIFNRWLVAEGLETKIEVSELLQVYRDHRPTLTPFPEVPALLAKLSSRFSLGLVSDGYLQVQEKKWEALGLNAYFRAVVFSDQWGRSFWKPHPRPFLEVTKLLGVTPQEAVYIADNPKKDFLGAKNSGLSSVWIWRATSEYGTLEPESKMFAPDFRLTDFRGLERLLG